jgi:hypothetical protein
MPTTDDKPDPRATFAAWLLARMAEADIAGPAELARAIGLDRRTTWRWVSGARLPSMAWWRPLAEALGVPHYAVVERVMAESDSRATGPRDDS